MSVSVDWLNSADVKVQHTLNDTVGACAKGHDESNSRKGSRLAASCLESKYQA